MPAVTLLVLLVVVAVPVAYWLGRTSAPAAPLATDPAELAERDAFIEQLRELAWQHRDVSPELSTIVIDEIAQRHRKGRGLPGPGA
ncbi:hypothetical protein [Nocardioides sp. zg-1228]|uniref:hypothetical protein n=1 Tax=Nocardioides sp. zg-1228 TaxID=2763008 RepID=UPI00164344F5|nr:hypothetical protein [Nocardioides sp. zg-1228]MBC2932817.1 hypothetical protein [Nocardioides sp. zg-1228]QSF56968.1 hypothetical protein JX575_15465 [Nocardioides sp. zg-1228]